MERIDKDNIGSTYAWRVCTASSIQDMLDGEKSLVNDINDEHEQWYKGLNAGEKLSQTIRSGAFLLTSPDTFTYIVLPHKEKPYPYIESAPRALVVLPPVRCLPNSDFAGLELNDITGSLQVEFPYGATESIRKALGFKINMAALKRNAWSSRVALLNIYGPNKYFLMHVFNDKANETVKNEVATWAANLNLARL